MKLHVLASSCFTLALGRAQHFLQASALSGHTAVIHWRNAPVPPPQLLARGCSVKAMEFMNLARHQRGKSNHRWEAEEILGSPPLLTGLRMKPTQPSLWGRTLRAGLAPEGYFIHTLPRVNTFELPLNELDFSSPTNVFLRPSIQSLVFFPDFLLMNNH